MCKSRTKSFYLVALLVLFVAPAFRAQVPGEASPAEALRARVVLYYGTLEKGQKTAAMELVAPESKNDFFHMNYDGLVEFRVLDVRLSDAGDTATVRLLRTDKFVGFPVPFERETVEKWKRLDGEWYILLPNLSEKKVVDTPFGKMTLGGRGENSQQATPPITAQVPQSMVTPEQARKALQKAMLASSKEKPEDNEKKPEDKKPAAQAVPKPNPQN